MKDKLKKIIKKGIYLIYPKQYKHTIWLIGSGRSGTTWISSIINYKNDFRELFEPFHTMFPIMSKMGFKKHLLLDDKTKKRGFRILAGVVLKGKIYNSRVEENNKITKLFSSEILLVKDIFANLMSYELCSKNPEIKPILIIRNPYAVALSKTKKKDWPWMHDPKDFLLQKRLREKYLLPFESKILHISQNGSYFERQVLIWCIINYVPLTQFNKGQLLITFYEDWCSNPNYELNRVYNYIGLGTSTLNDINDHSKFTSPSKTSASKEFNINEWKSNLSTIEINAGQEILKCFGFDKLYDSNSSPNHKHIDDFLSKQVNNKG